jgi:non-ribosomal peptide synthetase component E (peptide arylation enzyme)
VGARVVITSRDVASNGVQLSRQLATLGVTVMQATPATWQLLLEAGWQDCRQLRILCGGETLPRDLANQLRERSGSLWNMYGPTETTIWSTTHHVKPGEEGPVSIGCPIANTELFLLDRYLQPVPMGVSGEIFIGGEGIARGYLNRPDLTAEKFIPDPFSDKPGARLYKTGDLARYLPNGNIEFLGRADHQVKIRGFRIELGEIETVLGQHPDVQKAVVVAREDIPDDKRIVAYVVSKHGSVLSINELRGFLQNKLPKYTIPSAFVFLDTLPLTPNGKVDRRALPTPEGLRSGLEAAYEAPQTYIQELIVSVWQQVLGVRKVGIHDNFFDLGGNSLLMAEVQSKLGAVFDQDLMIDMLKYPTVYSLANYLGQEVRESVPLPENNDFSKRLESGKSRLRELRTRRQGGSKMPREYNE